jgi:hypothetical protein
VRDVLSEAALIAQGATPQLAGRVAVRRPATGTSVAAGPHGAVTLTASDDVLAGDGRGLAEGLRVQLSIWQALGTDDEPMLTDLRAAFDQARGWRWLGRTELVEQPGDLLQHVVALGYARRVPS